MGLAEATASVGTLLDAYGERAWKLHVAADEDEDAGAPPSMQVGNVDEDGWVEWRLLPSTLTEPDLVMVERDFSVKFPPLFRRERVEPLAQTLYLSCREFLLDVFGDPSRDA